MQPVYEAGGAHAVTFIWETGLIETLTRIAENSDDPQVAMEALRQLAELRKTDVGAAKDAYRDD